MDQEPRRIMAWEEAPPSPTYAGPDTWRKWGPVVEALIANPGREAKIMVDTQNACASLVNRIRQRNRPWAVTGGVIVAKRRRVWLDDAHTQSEHRVYASYEPYEKENPA
jgi:hypothetical protein